MTPTQQIPDNPQTVVDDLAKWNLEGYHAQALLEFMRLMRGGGNFSLILLQYNDLGYRDRVIPYLNRYASNPTILHVDPETDFASFEQTLFSLVEGHDLVHVTGLNEWLLSDRDAKFRGFNYHRELIAGKVKSALALWMTEYDIRDFAVQAPDMWAWRKGVLDFNVLKRERDLLEFSPVDLHSADVNQRRKRINEIEAWLAEHSEDTISRANLLRELGRIKCELGYNNAALKALELAKNIYRGHSYKRDYAVVVEDMAKIFRHKGEVETALRMHNEALQLFEKLGDLRSQGSALNEIAQSYADMGKWENALELFQQCIGMSLKVGDDGARAVTLGNIAQIYMGKGDLEKALQLLQESLLIHKSSGDKVNYALTLCLSARINSLKGDQETALRLFEEALNVFEALGDRRSWAITLGDIAIVYTSMGEVEKALKLHTERLSVFEEQGDAGEIAHTLWSLGRVHLLKGDEKKALPVLKRAYDIYKKLGRMKMLPNVAADLGQVLCRTGQNQAGVNMLHSAEEGLRKLGRDDQAAIIKRMIDKFVPRRKKVQKIRP